MLRVISLLLSISLFSALRNIVKGKAVLDRGDYAVDERVFRAFAEK